MKTTKTTCLVALLTAGTLMFQGCKDKNDPVNEPTKPTTPTEESVKTSFAFNIPYVGKTTKSAPTTRMTAANTQANGQDFIGMHDIFLANLGEAAADATTLKSVISLGTLDPKGGTNTLEDNGQKVYSNVNIPVETSHFLFYAAGGTSTPSTTDAKFTNGILTVNGLSTTTATPGDISFNLEYIYTTGTDIATDTEAQTLLTVLNDVASAAGWSTSTAVSEKSLYEAFISLTNGSAASIISALTTLENTANTMVTINNSTGVPAAIAAKIANHKNTLTNLTFPRNLNLPDGVARIRWDVDNSAFEYVQPNYVTAANTLNPALVCFPASLYYFVSTEVRETALETVPWPLDATAWAAEQWTGWGNKVQSTTRTIALKDNVQYSVASLKTTVRCNAGTLEDNKGKDIAVPTDGFPVTGILIGGQPSTVNWQFLADGNDAFTNVVYDKMTGVFAPNGAASGENYTLVLDNSTAPANKEKVIVVIELTNNTGAAFEGVDGQVEAGSSFYLCAELTPATANATVTGVTSVFKKAYVTTANLTIKSLGNAYNTIPDLSTVKMNLGLSVDLEWKAGLEFDIDID